MKLSDNELKVMEIIWDENYLDEDGEITAKKVSDILIEKYGWNKNSNYVYFRRLLEKGVISRRYPNYTIKSLIQKEDIVNKAIDKIIDNTFGGSILRFFNAFISDKKITPEDIEGMKEIINSFEITNKDKKRQR